MRRVSLFANNYAFRGAIAAVAMMLAACGSKAPDFQTALDVHLASIAARDLEAFKATTTSGDDLYVIFPTGAALTTTAEVIDFHEAWFDNDEWSLEPEVVKTIVGKDVAIALIKYNYRDTPDTPARSSWLVLVFKLEDGEWRLVHDQNTRIEQSAAAAERSE